jgi:DNA-binding MarR family transcriptional regulator
MHIHDICGMQTVVDQALYESEALEVNRTCMLTRARLIARVITNIYDQELRPFGINSPQYALLGVIAEIGPATRTEIAHHNHQERSTLSRNLQIMLDAGWIEELPNDEDRRSRPLVVKPAGRELMHNAMPAWRAGQARAKSRLGDDGMNAIIQVADDIVAG